MRVGDRFYSGSSHLAVVKLCLWQSPWPPPKAVFPSKGDIPIKSENLGAGQMFWRRNKKTIEKLIRY